MYAHVGADDTKPCWRWRPSHLLATPSRKDGITMDHERALRRAGVGDIVMMAMTLFGESNWRAPATTAAVLFQRFFMRQSFASNDRHLLSAAAFFLATKLEEHHRKVRFAMSAAYCVHHEVEKPPFDSSGAPAYIAYRDSVLDNERKLLYTLEFDVAVPHPYSTITSTIKAWRDKGRFGAPRGAGSGSGMGAASGATSSEKHPELATFDRAAAEVALECMCSELCLLFSATEIAAGALFIAWCTLTGHGAAALAGSSTAASSSGGVSSSASGGGVLARLSVDDFACLVRDPRLLDALVSRYEQEGMQLLKVEKARRPSLAAAMPAAVGPTAGATGDGRAGLPAGGSTAGTGWGFSHDIFGDASKAALTATATSSAGGSMGASLVGSPPDAVSPSGDAASAGLVTARYEPAGDDDVAMASSRRSGAALDGSVDAAASMVAAAAVAVTASASMTSPASAAVFSYSFGAAGGAQPNRIASALSSRLGRGSSGLPPTTSRSSDDATAAVEGSAGSRGVFGGGVFGGS